MLQLLARKSSSRKDRAGFADLLARTKPILDYVMQQPAIEAAAKKIENHKAQYDELLHDQDAYQQRTHALFAEKRFVPLRFTADDVGRAFDKVGKPLSDMFDDQFGATVRQAILYLADKDWRHHSAMSILLHLPDYVAANRPLDAWIIQHCAYVTQEEAGESNAFLFQMFSYGYEGWVAEQRDRELAMIRELGMDLPRLERMSMEEIEAWLQQQEADPAKRARMEKLLLANPEHRVQAEANLRRVKRDAHQILERPDAAHLLLSPDEIQPWVPIVSESFARTREQFPDLATPSPSAAAGEAFVAAIFPLVREMVAKLFTPERIGSLTAQLKAYRNERFAAGDKKIAELANGAIIHVKDEDEPDCNIFLCALGYLSLIRGSKQMAAQLQAPAPSPDEPAG